MFGRNEDLARLGALTRQFPVVGIVGARQVGKTTLARAFAERTDGPTHHLDLEDPAHLARLADPMLALEPMRGLVIIDEIQRAPDLFPVLRVLADRQGAPARFVVLGSASPDLLRQGSESLAGRIAYLELEGLSLLDTGSESIERLWLRGGFPRSFLAESDGASMRWRQAFVRTFLERDLPQLGIGVPAARMRRFWTMLAHTHGQIHNGADIAASLGVSQPTVRSYLNHLEGALMCRQLRAWHENLGKRQVKAPKIYLSDSGLLHTLLNLPDPEDLHSYPRMGASWEGFLVHEVVRTLVARWDEAYFWATHAGAELDLLVVRGRRRLGFEFKRTVLPRVERSMRIAFEDLGLERLTVVHAGRDSFPLADRIHALAAASLRQELKPL
jgi:uncharacterized protein